MSKLPAFLSHRTVFGPALELLASQNKKTSEFIFAFAINRDGLVKGRPEVGPNFGPYAAKLNSVNSFSFEGVRVTQSNTRRPGELRNLNQSRVTNKTFALTAALLRVGWFKD